MLDARRHGGSALLLTPEDVPHQCIQVVYGDLFDDTGSGDFAAEARSQRKRRVDGRCR
jgi:hypothetical protein